jgi:GT2 family glycosyltransferase
MKIALVTIAYNSGQSIQRLVETGTQCEHEVRVHLFLHSQHLETVAACRLLARLPAVTYYDYGCNRGVSNSWNEGILNAYGSGADIVIVVNDDIHFYSGDVSKIAARSMQFRNHYIISCAGFHRRLKRQLPSHGYSCFAINPIAMERIGCFDENFFPSYCEDQDYAYRAKLVGLHEENCPDTNISHGGSDTIFSDPILNLQNRMTHGRNMQYYIRKWGAPGGRERWNNPFNDPHFDCQILPEKRHAPYGASYDRTDRDIVRV